MTPALHPRPDRLDRHGQVTVAAMFERRGVPVFDADAEVRAMQGPGGELLPAIEAAFPGTTGPEGVDRDGTGQQVFGDADALARLEAIVHPAVRRQARGVPRSNMPARRWSCSTSRCCSKRAAPTRSMPSWSSPHRAEVQRAPGPGPPGHDAPRNSPQILGLQLPDAEKRARADHVIDTGAPLAETRGAGCRRWWRTYKLKARSCQLRQRVR